MATHSVLTVELDGANVAVEVIRRPTSRRLSLRVDTALGRPRVSAPTSVAAADIATFLLLNKSWLRQRLAKLPTPVPFVEGAKSRCAGFSTGSTIVPAGAAPPGSRRGRPPKRRRIFA